MKPKEIDKILKENKSKRQKITFSSHKFMWFTPDISKDKARDQFIDKCNELGYIPTRIAYSGSPMTESYRVSSVCGYIGKKLAAQIRFVDLPEGDVVIPIEGVAPEG